MGTSAIQRLEGVWRRKSPDVAKGLAKPATAAALAKLEEAARGKLPKAMRELYAAHDGMKDEHQAVEGFFGWMSIQKLLAAKKTLDGMERDGFFEDWRSGEWWNEGFLPFLQFNNEDYVCVDLDGTLGLGKGAVFARGNADPVRVVLAPTFEAWIDQHVAILETVPEGGDEDEFKDAFEGAAAKKIRARVSPGFPKQKKAKRASR